MPQWSSAPQVARAAYYDRNAAVIIIGHTSTQPNHVATLRASYTAPNNFGAFIEAIHVDTARATAGAPSAEFAMYVTFQPSGGTERVIISSVQNPGVVGVHERWVVTNFGFMSSGDAIRLYTYDTSAGGTVGYSGSIKGVEFEL